ncbi:hypothetical protein LY474_38140 [Myxococcus stipitatus]|uniref:hypothetical protein n=1 Tax=Myxococcus stipitatus TaxID=83455 RepID=UPI001F46750E|nr:hypothetical protein [Myxococcus stipitatus]MCE9673641.1 hypothetical protein [Myxococcus stipitatus]
MTERTRWAAAPTRTPSLEETRLQLEGRAEVLEAALAREAALERALRSARWKARLRANPEWVEEQTRREPEVVEALERVRRRAELEGWSQDTPIQRVVHALLARRERLKSLVRRRLASLTSVSGAPVLDAELARLAGLVRREASFQLDPREVLVHETLPLRDWPPVHAFLAISYGGVAYVLFALLMTRPGPGKEFPLLAALLLFLLPLVALVLRSGEVRLTSKRLIWRPKFGETVAIPLDSLRFDSFRWSKLLKTVHLEGERRVRLRHQGDGARLLTLLALHGSPPLAGAARAGVLAADVVVYPVVLREGGLAREGHAILRPGGVFFVPKVDGARVFEAVTGREAPTAMDAACVLEQLRWLPAAEVDECLARVVAATGGSWWSAWESRHEADVPAWKRIQINKASQVLTGKVDWSTQSRVEHILRAWPRVSG